MTTERASDSNARGRLIGRLGDVVSQICLVVAAIALLAIVAINVANVTGRYVFGAPFTWAEELMLFLMILVVFTAAPVAAWRNQHIRIEMFIDHTSPAIRRSLLVVAAVISVAIMTLVTAAGYHIVAMLHLFDQRSDALRLPMWIPQAFLVGGLALSAAMIAATILSGRIR